MVEPSSSHYFCQQTLFPFHVEEKHLKIQFGSIYNHFKQGDQLLLYIWEQLFLFTNFAIKIKYLPAEFFFLKFLLCVINDIFLTPDKWTKLSNTYITHSWHGLYIQNKLLNKSQDYKTPLMYK